MTIAYDWLVYKGTNHAVYFGEGSEGVFCCGLGIDDECEGEDDSKPYCDECESYILKGAK